MSKTVYVYRDENGVELYRKLREDTPEGKRIGFSPAGYFDKGGRRVIYNLPEVLGSTHVAITEGEKCCDIGNSLGLDWTFTTSGSSNSWSDIFTDWFKGKHVVILPDNDPPGRRYAETVAASLYGKAASVSICELPGLPEKGDIADYVAAGKTGEDVEASITFYSVPYSPPPKLEAPVRTIFQRFSEIPKPEKIDWLVEAVIERGTNGLLYAEPKMSKSWVALDLALHMANGQHWFGQSVAEGLTVGVVSREDSPGVTRRRVEELSKGYGLDPDKLLIATRDNLYDARLDNSDWVEQMRVNIETLGIDFLFWDVFNRFHAAEENNNTEIRKVLDNLDYLTAKTGCNHCLIHHVTKGSKSPRGASCIDGWAEFRMRIEWADKERKRRSLVVDGKSSAELKPIVYTIQPRNGGIALVRDMTANLGPVENDWDAA